MAPSTSDFGSSRVPLLLNSFAHRCQLVIGDSQRGAANKPQPVCSPTLRITHGTKFHWQLERWHRWNTEVAGPWGHRCGSICLGMPEGVGHTRGAHLRKAVRENEGRKREMSPPNTAEPLCFMAYNAEPPAGRTIFPGLSMGGGKVTLTDHLLETPSAVVLGHLIPHFGATDPVSNCRICLSAETW